MAKTFFAGMKGGSYKACIYQGPDDVITTPGNRLQDVFFHSDLAYLKSNTAVAGSVTLPLRTPGTSASKKKGTTVIVPAYGTSSYQLTATDYTSSNVVVVDTDNNRTISGTTIYQQLSDDSFRILNLTIGAGGVYLSEAYTAYSSSLPAITFNYKIYPVVDPTSTTDATYWMYINSGNFRIKNGTFNSSLGYVDINSQSDTGGATTSKVEYSSYYYSTGGSLQRFSAYYPESNKTEFNWDMFTTSRPHSDKDTGDSELWKAGTIVSEQGQAFSKYNIDDGFTYERGAEQFRKTTYNASRVYYVRNAANNAWIYSQTVTSDVLCSEKYASVASANGQAPNQYSPVVSSLSANVSNGNAATQHGSGGWYQFNTYYPRTGTTLTYLAKDVNVQATGSVIFYQIRRSKITTVTTGRSGAALVNGQTIAVYDDTDRASGSILFNYDGQRKAMGGTEGKAIPSNKIYGLNLK